MLRSIGAAGAVALVLTSCGDSRARVRADESVLIEITGRSTARVTVRANEFSLFSNPLTPRGGPPTASTTTRPLTDQEVKDAMNALGAELRRGPKIGISHPRATIAAVGDVIARHSVVTQLEARTKQITATLRFDHLGPAVRFAPAAVVRALNRDGVDRAKSIWVGVCVAPTRGDWASSPDTFNRARGCAGWVPDSRASSVGVLHSRSAIRGESWLVVLLSVLALALIAVCVIRARVRPLRRIRWLWLAPLVILVSSVVIGFALLSTAVAIGDIQDVFGAKLEQSTRHLATLGATAGMFIAIASVFALLWTVSQPADIDR